MIRVLVADDHLAVREGVRTLLANEREITIVGEADDGSTALALARSLRPDLIVLDDSMPGIGSLDVARTLLAELPGTAVVFLARNPGMRDLALAAGATAFVSKDAPSEELLRALRASTAAVTARQQLSALKPEGRRVVELLLGSRVMTQEQVQEALAKRAAGESLATTVVRLGLLGQPELADVLARATDTPFVSLAPYPEISTPIDPTEARLSSPRLIDPVERDAARSVPFDVARGLGVVITAADRGHGVVAMADPLDEAAFAEAQRHSHLRLTRVTATADDIRDTLERVWNGGGSRDVIWTGNLLSKLYASVVLGVIIVGGIGGFGVLFRDALAPRFAFSLFALFCGLFFFLYALKYYVTIASVILITLFGDPAKFQGRHANGNGNGHVNGKGLKADGQSSGNGQSSGQHKEGYRTLRGENLSEGGSVQVNDPWQRMGEIRLPADKQPFVSVQLALYNEKRVVDRLLEACTSFDYENYEVIVVDDSTDETVELLKRWKEHPRVRVIHRSSRKGFKGGALQEALRRMNPRTEYVMIFDADFVPPADAIWHFLDYFGRLAKAKNGNGNGHAKNGNGHGAPTNGDRLAVVQGYQWHMLNASENWITKGVRAEFAGSYVLERAGQELFGAMKMISGSVYMIRADVLRKLGWSTSITEDWELTIRLYLAGYKVLYTPYIQAPAECVSKVNRLIKQRMRWAEGHTYNVKKYFWQILRSPNLTWQEKLEFAYYAPYYLQSVLFTVATLAWVVGVLILGQKLPMWGEVFGWSLVVSNALALPLMNLTGVLLEGSLKRDALGLLSFIGLSWLLVPFQAYASIKALFEKKEGGWVRTPKSGHVTETLERFHLARLMPWELPRRKRGQEKAKAGGGRFAAVAVVVLAAAGILTVGALSIRAAATSGIASETDIALPAILGTAVPLAILALGWLRLRRRMTAVVLAFTLGLGTNIVYLANAVPAISATDNSSTFTLARSSSYATPNLDMKQNYTPQGAGGIAFRDARATNTNATTFITVNSPIGSAAGDVDIAIVTWICGASCATISVTASTGWTQIGSPVTNSTMYTKMFYRVEGTAPPANFQFNSNVSGDTIIMISGYSGVDTINPIAASGISPNAACTIPCGAISPTVTTSVANTFLITTAFAPCGQSGVAWTAPTGMTDRGTVSSSSPGNIMVELADVAVASAGATGSKSTTMTSGGTCTGSQISTGTTVALRSAPTTCPTIASGSWTCKWVSDQMSQGQTANGTVLSNLYLDNSVLPTFSCAGSATQGAGATSIALNKPACVTAAGYIMIAAVAVRGGSTNPAFTPPANWNLIGVRIDSSIVTSLALYWKLSTASEAASYTWSWGATSQKAVGAIQAFSNVDTTTPVDVYSGVLESGASTSHTTPNITPTYENEMIVTSFTDATNNSAAVQWTPPTGFTEDIDSWSTGGGAGNNISLELNHLAVVNIPARGTGSYQATSASSAVGGTFVVALKPAPHTCTFTETLYHTFAPQYVTPNGSTSASVSSGTSLSIATPTGVAQDDVMIASIAYAGGSNVTSITVPSGWTLIGTATNSTTVVGMAVYRKTAGASEAGPYAWSFTPTQNASGIISAYRNVDTTTPVDVQAYLATAAPTCPSPCTHTTSSVTPTGVDEMIVASFVTAANDTWTPPGGMNERGDTKNTGATFVALEQNDVLQLATGAVSKTALAVSTSAVGVTHILALRGKAATTAGSVTRAISSPSTGVALYTDTVAASINETFNLGDRFEFDVTVTDTTNCNAAVTYDGETEGSNVNVATIVPEGVLGLLLLAPALPFGARWWKRRRP